MDKVYKCELTVLFYLYKIL